MKDQHHPHDPALPGDNPEHGTFEAFRIAAERLAAGVTTRSLPSYIPVPAHLRDQWISAFIMNAQASRQKWSAAFNQPSWLLNIQSLQAVWNVFQEYNTSLEILPTMQRRLTAVRNSLMFAKPQAVSLPPPPPEPALLPRATATHAGIAWWIAGMVDVLKVQPGFSEGDARQFGILPTPTSHPDPSEFDPQVTAKFNGGWVELNFRSPKGLRGVDFAEIRADYGDGTGVHLIGTTAFSRFGDHHEIPEGRTLFKYWVCYITRDGLQLGQQSTCEVVVQGRVN